MAVQKSFFEVSAVPLPATVKFFQSVQTCFTLITHVQSDQGSVLKVVSMLYDDYFWLQARKTTKSSIFQIWYVELKIAVQKSFFEVSAVPLPVIVKIFQRGQTCFTVMFHVQNDQGNVLKLV